MRSLEDLPYLEWVEPDSGETVRLYADAFKDEALTMPAIVTDHPVEVGSKISDHYRKDAETYRALMFFSGSPLRADLDSDFQGSWREHALVRGTYPEGPPIYTPGGIRNAAGAAIGAVGSLLFGGDAGPTSFNAFEFEQDPSKRATKAVETVRRLQVGGILLAVRTIGFGRLENMAITNCSPHKSVDMGDGAEFEFDLKEIRTVSSDIAFSTPDPVEPRGKPAKKGVNAGAGNSVPAGPKKTALAGLIDSFRSPL